MALQEKNNGFGPVSEDRGNRASIARMIFLGLVLVLIPVYYVCYSNHSLKDMVNEIALLYCSVISSLVLGEIFRRSILYFEEKFHVETRYSGSKIKAFQHCIAFPKTVLVIFVFFVSTFGMIVCRMNSDGYDLFPWPLYVLITCWSSVGMQLLEVRSLSLVEVSQLTETKINNVATGLAWSYYFGYLKLILPGIQGMVRKAVKPDFVLDGNDLRDKISSEKVFIIIPKNCWCYESFDKVDKRISFLTSMPEQRITRGGVQERVYKNTLYRIQLEGKEPKYIMMEYATPLLALFDMARESNAQFTMADRDEQVVEFYKKLKYILERIPECRDKFRIVLVSDAHDNLAEVIYQELQEESIRV
ncbi:stimulator of interferon genes protein-like [Hydractinia symbiolongicarpus]|uniref:stimulator of interferon genes protein-like n=1 Tax=Hydractinia symbiolongicarpus TaxID=13093 RepID=UPI0025501622|nr:stimulator of interferon genes protein-like [Hydractinia symbiolongicarpus]